MLVKWATVGENKSLDLNVNATNHDDVTKWKHFPRYWTFDQGIPRSPVNSPHKGQWRGVWMISLICAWINGWVNNFEAGDLRRHHAHYDGIVMNVCSLALCSFYENVCSDFGKKSYWVCCIVVQDDLLSLCWLNKHFFSWPPKTVNIV